MKLYEAGVLNQSEVQAKVFEDLQKYYQDTIVIRYTDDSVAI